MKVFLIKTDYGLIPAHASDHEVMAKFHKGDIVEVEVRKARNLLFHKKFFALLKVGFDAQNSFDSFDWWREWITMKAGHFETCRAPNGADLYRAKSISFNKMDGLEFDQLYKDVSNAIIKVCRITPEQIDENLNLFL